MKEEVDVLVSLSLSVCTVSADVKQHLNSPFRVKELCEKRVLGSLSRIVRTVSVDVTQH